MSIGDQQVEVAVVVVVEKFYAPAAHGLRGPGDTRRRGNILESLVVFVVINPIQFVIQIRHEKIHPAILVQIRRIHPHARPRFFPLLRTPPQAVKPISSNRFPGAIGENKIRGRVVSHEKIQEAVVVNVRCHRAPGFAGITAYARLLAHVRERAVAIVVE